MTENTTTAADTLTATVEAHLVHEDDTRTVRDVVTVSIRHAHVLGGYLRGSWYGPEIAPENFGTMKLAGLDAVYFDWERTELPMLVQFALADLEDLRDELGLNREKTTLRFRTN